VVGNGTAIVPIGGGLTVTNITVSGTTPSIATLESGKHYIYNGAGASGDVTITMPAVAAESNIRVTVYNIPTTRKMSLARAGSDNFRKDDTLYTTVEFRAVEVEQSSEFVAATDAAEWLVNDGSNALGTVWSGALTVSGLLTASSGINLGNETLSVYDEGSFNATFNAGMNTSTNVILIRYVRIGNLVTLAFPDIRVTANATATNWSTGISNIPAIITPSVTRTVPIQVQYTNKGEPGILYIYPNGTLSAYRPAEVTFSSGDLNCGFYFSNCTYLLNN
jgi:hypothetical protein